MKSRKFNDVFKNIPFSSEIINAFKNSPVKVKAITDMKRVDIELGADEKIDKQIINKFKAELKDYFSPMSVSVIIPNSKKSNITEYIEKSKGEIASAVFPEDSYLRSALENAHWDAEDDLVTISFKSDISFLVSEEKIIKTIKNKIENDTKMEIKIKLDASDDMKTRKDAFFIECQNKEKQLISLYENSPNKAKAPAKQKDPSLNKRRFSSNNAPFVFGEKISDASEKIIKANIEGETFVIEGSIFNIVIREIKRNEKNTVILVTFDITDKTSSTSVKFFTKKEYFDSKIKGNLKEGEYYKIKGNLNYDKYSRDYIISAKDMVKIKKPKGRTDTSTEKRVELHVHTQMSSMDAMNSAKDYIAKAVEWGHKAIAITDHGVVQAFPEAMTYIEKGKLDIKIIYGVEAYLIDDLGTSVTNPKNKTTNDVFTVFDLETTGLNRENDRIIEIGAVKIQNGQIIDTFSSFINPGVYLSEKIVKLTGITDAMLKDAKCIDDVLPVFVEFIGDSILAAHNASFDMGFLRAAASRLYMPDIDNTVIDTLELSRSLFTDLKSHKLQNVATACNVKLKEHHRAINDAEMTAGILMKMIEMLSLKGIAALDAVNAFTSSTVNYKALRANHAVILVKNQEGMKDLYTLVSNAHLKYYNRRPRIPKSEYIKCRGNLLIGSACEAGELYQAILDGKPKEYIESIADFYDYLEIQPVGNNRFMIDSPKYPDIKSVNDIIKINKEIVALGEKLGKPVAATCDVHFLEPDNESFRRIIMAGEGYEDADNQAPLYFRTTEEMLQEFKYLGEEKAKEVVITNTNLIADMIKNVRPVPKDTFPPEIEGSEKLLRDSAVNKAISIYGEPLPSIVSERLDKELNSIISNGYAVLYIAAQKLVTNSIEHGYLVGSRGSVGSSLAATMAGITEVNPLPPHYVCPKCKYSDFSSDIVKKAFLDGDSGCDMPDKNCPVCGTLLKKEGHDIPFETFLGFGGDKEPDIDLNFSGEFQQQAHAYTEELFGKENVFKAGTISTMAEKTAYGFVKKYFEEKNIILHNAEINRLVAGCTGVKRTTGQHPGGIIVLPRGHDINEFCPVQHPADKINTDIITTHFDYHAISDNLLKLDLLGHQDPTVIKMLKDLTGKDPQEVLLDDEETLSLFETPKALGVSAEEIDCPTGTLGIPEFGTRFVIKMLTETKPKNFSDLIRISGLSHGTDVWNSNAQDLIKNGITTLKGTVSTRDSIMLYLINKGVDSKMAFGIMETVRKGRELSDEQIVAMETNEVPDWYINSCKKIKYLFPKAHAVAYVTMAFRIAYFKINYPLAYYAAYFSVRAEDDFDYNLMCLGYEKVKSAIKAFNEKGNQLTAKEKNKLTILEIAAEFYARGFSFAPLDLYKSDAKKFIPIGNTLLPPFNSIQGLGLTAAQSIVNGRADGEFKTMEEFKKRTSVGKTLTEVLAQTGIFEGIPDTTQLSLF